VVNFVIPWLVIAGASAVTLVRLLYTAAAACRSNQAGQGTPAAEVAADADDGDEYVRSTAIAQLCASLVFVVLGLPAHVHQLSVMLAESAPVGIETYMTQRLLLVVLYSRCSSTFFVHVVANRCFRRRLADVLLRLVRRRSDCCSCPRCGRSSSAAISVTISLTPTQMWSRPPANDGAC